LSLRVRRRGAWREQRRQLGSGNGKAGPAFHAESGAVNCFKLRASMVERAAARLTPAGVPVVEAQFHCLSEVVEGGMARTLDFRVDAVGLGSMAAELERSALGTELELEGFLAPRSKRSARLVLHVTGCRRVAAAGMVAQTRSEST
jgi:primosomal replication protein N